ncbi:MAG: hypothetical protein ACOCXT_06655 [Candidatus Dojkabacteria bacterium]
MLPEMIGSVPEYFQDATRNIDSAVRVVFPTLISKQHEQHFDPMAQSDTGLVIWDLIVDHPGKTIYAIGVALAIGVIVYLYNKADNSNNGSGWHDEGEMPDE